MSVLDILNQEGPADRAAAEVRRRRDALLAWGAAEKVPEAHGQLAALTDFFARWDGLLTSRPDEHELRAATNDLAVAEGLAEAHGYASDDVRRVPGVGTAPLPVSTQMAVDPATAHPVADGIDQHAPDLHGAPRSGTGPQKRAGEPGGPDPLLAVKVGAVGGLLLATGAGALAAPAGAGRVAVAVGGAVVTVAAALAMFLPGAPPAEKKEPKP